MGVPLDENRFYCRTYNNVASPRCHAEKTDKPQLSESPMPGPQTAPYGSWKSPITSDLIVAGTIGLEQIALDGDDIYWIEARPSEAGRNVIVRRTPHGKITDVTPTPFNARTRVHEYGGGAY